jgi:hypothetical protein
MYRAKKVKENSTENIKKYTDYKIVNNLTKEHSPNSIAIIQDKDDD